MSEKSKEIKRRENDRVKGEKIEYEIQIGIF